MKTSSLPLLGSQMPACPIGLPSSKGVGMGYLCELGTFSEAFSFAVVFEAEGGRIITKARVPLFGDVTMVER